MVRVQKQGPGFKSAVNEVGGEEGKVEGVMQALSSRTASALRRSLFRRARSCARACKQGFRCVCAPGEMKLKHGSMKNEGSDRHCHRNPCELS